MSLRRNSQVVYRPLAEGEGGVLLNLESGQYHGVNQVGLLVWDLIDGERSQDEIVGDLRSQLVDPPAMLTEEIAAFLDELRARNLILE